MDNILIELKNVSKTYSTAAGDFTALKNVSLRVNAGEFLGIVGKSGAGKSTLLNMVNGVDQLTDGEVIVHDDGENISVHAMSEDDRARWRGRKMGVVYQSFQLLPMLTLIENITLPMDLSDNFKPRESRDRAMQLLQLVELEEHANKLPAFISGGQQQRVAIARALANDPSWLRMSRRAALTPLPPITSSRSSNIWFPNRERRLSWLRMIQAWRVVSREI